MPFERGSFTVGIFKLNGPWPEDALKRFNIRHAGTLDSVKDDVQIGWTSGKCLLDTSLEENNVMMGGCWYLNLRKAERKIPSALMNAIVRREEIIHMRANNLDFVPSKVRREIKAQVTEQYLMKMPPALSAIPMVFDPAAKLLYVGAGSPKQIDEFIGFFFQTMELEPQQITPGMMLNSEFGKLETDLPALPVNDDAGADDLTMGRDFLTYLWYLSETGATKISHPQYGEFELLIEGPLAFAAGAEAQGAGETVVKKGDHPQQSAEVKAALSVGKKLKKAKVTLTRGDDIWSGTFDADKFVFGSLTLPEGEELDLDSRFGERMQNLYIFHEAWQCCFRTFAEAMFHDHDRTVKAVREWAASRNSY